MNEELRRQTENLINEYGGPHLAYEFASKEAIRVSKENKLYELSWWRDIKRELKKIIHNSKLERIKL